MADRFYCPDPIDGGQAHLVGDEARHLARVRRVLVGEEVELFDGRGTSYRAEVQALGRDRVDLAVLGSGAPDRFAPCHLTLATAVPKGDRVDWLVEKATELGVSRLVPLLAERSTVDPRDAKLERLRRVIVEASKQCGRNRLMDLDRPTSFRDHVQGPRPGVRLLAHPSGLPYRSWPRIGSGDSVALVIGPEGGFTEHEVKAACESGWNIISLGSTLLRIETAGLVGSAAILALIEESKA